MYQNNDEIKKIFASQIVQQFGEKLQQDIDILINRISDKDAFIDNNIWLNLQNILTLDKEQATYFVNLTLQLSLSSPVIPVLLLEKIPTLLFYNIATEVSQFLLTIIDYGVRSAAYYLGCDQRKVDDLLQILEESTLTFYKALLHHVSLRHQEFNMHCGLIMRFSTSLEKMIRETEIPMYLDICKALMQKFGTTITEQYIRHTHEIFTQIPLDMHLSTINEYAQKSLIFAEFFVTYPLVIFKALATKVAPTLYQQPQNLESIRNIKVELLKTEDYLSFLNNPWLFTDREFFSMMLAWPQLTSAIKINILAQLQHKNYKHYLLSNPSIASQYHQINAVTKTHWFEAWTFCGEVVDLIYMRKKMSALLQDRKNFSIEAKTIIKTHNAIFNRNNTEYNTSRIANMLQVLLTYCINSTAVKELSAMHAFVSENHQPLKNLLSESSLVIRTWERDPWNDYGRADELFSCTSLGDYNAGNAPAFLTDLNLNHLDIWSNGVRVGRIHLCLTRDAAQNTLLLLDSVDGSERSIGSRKKLEFIMNAVQSYARWLGITQIKVNYDIDYNTTPKKFIAYIEKTLNYPPQVDFISRFSTENTINMLLPYPCQTYLESFIKSNGAFVRGAMINEAS